MPWTFDDFGGDVWAEDDVGSDWRPDDLGGTGNGSEGLDFGNADDNGDHNRFITPDDNGDHNRFITPDDNGDHNRFINTDGTLRDLTNLGVSDGSSTSVGALTQLAKSLGLTNSSGGIDWSKILGLGGAAASLMGAGSSGTVKTPAELRASLPSNAPPMWSAEQVAAMQVPLKAGNQLTRQYAADMPTPIRPGQGYAEGGEVEGALSALFDSSQGDAYVQGPGDGQSDSVDAKLARGEYVFDAETVSMLGDGSNEAGAERLDELRAQIRAHKRSAPDDEIAPPSLGALSYMNGGLNG